MEIKKFQVPATRDPFINTDLINAGVDPETGEERFWISTWNTNVGCLGALITETGKSRIYRFPKANDGLICCGAYSAYLTDNDTIWLMSDLKAFVKLTLSTGEYEILYTGAPGNTLVSTAAMQYDEATGKIMTVAFAAETGLTGVSFDTKEKRTVKIYENFALSTVCKGSFSNGNGTYTFRFANVEPSLYQWNPVEETFVKQADITEEIEWIKNIRDDSGRIYIPYQGWLNLTDYSFDTGDMPEREAVWFKRRGCTAYGYICGAEANEFYTWDIPTGEVTKLCQTRDTGGCNMTRDGHILNVSVYGEFCKFSPEGELVFSKMLDSDARNAADCIIKVDDKTVIGTPFISQRFWIINTETGEGFDAGRATPGRGEVLRTWNINGKIYMASYCEGYLAEYDPEKPINYPENPRAVAQAPGMRPVADAQKGDVLYYACTHEYGKLGCVLTRYDTQSGEALYKDDLIHAQHILSMYYVPGDDIIVAGTTYISDCCVTPMESDECYLMKIHTETLEILDKIKAPKGCKRASVHGAIDENTLLISYIMENETQLGAYDIKDGSVTIFKETLESFGSCMKAEMFLEIKLAHYMNQPGRFVMKTADSVVLCRASNSGFEIEKTIFEDKDIYMFSVSGGSIYAATPTQLFMADGIDK